MGDRDTPKRPGAAAVADIAVPRLRASALAGWGDEREKGGGP